MATTGKHLFIIEYGCYEDITMYGIWSSLGIAVQICSGIIEKWKAEGVYEENMEFGNLMIREYEIDVLNGKIAVYNCMGRKVWPIDDLVPKEDFTCTKCSKKYFCEHAFDWYNIGGDCLAEK